MDHNTLKKVSDIIKNCEEGYFGYMGSNGYPHVATRSKLTSDNISTCYFSSNTSGSMASSISKDSRASVCFRLGNDNVTLIGDASLVHDQDVKNELWIDWFINHYPEGPTDPEFALIRFDTKKLSLWIDRKVIKADMKTLSLVTSRCGLLCQTCEWKEPYKCGGCIETMGNPFHGECPIAICAQEKDLDHCGQCPDMPCDQLKNYSCGDGEHCDQPKGARLEVLEFWNR